MNNEDQAKPLKPPQIVSMIAIMTFTLFVALCSAFTLYITYVHFDTQRGWTVCAMAVLSVFALVGYRWHRVFTEKPIVKHEVTQEQAEGVWPPAPVMTAEGNNT